MLVIDLKRKPFVYYIKRSRGCATTIARTIACTIDRTVLPSAYSSSHSFPSPLLHFSVCLLSFYAHCNYFICPPFYLPPCRSQSQYPLLKKRRKKKRTTNVAKSNRKLCTYSFILFLFSIRSKQRTIRSVYILTSHSQKPEKNKQLKLLKVKTPFLCVKAQRKRKRYHVGRQFNLFSSDLNKPTTKTTRNLLFLMPQLKSKVAFSFMHFVVPTYLHFKRNFVELSKRKKGEKKTVRIKKRNEVQLPSTVSNICITASDCNCIYLFMIFMKYRENNI